MSKMSELDIEQHNLCPGTPERPVAGSELTFKNLKGDWIEQAKLDGDRVILSHGMAFNRHGKIYQRDFKEKLGDIYKELRYLFDERVFDIEYLPTGPNAGKCALLDVPNMYTMGRRDLGTYRDANNVTRSFGETPTPYGLRHLIIKSTLPCQPAHMSHFEYDICALPSHEGVRTYGELYRDMKTLNESIDDYPFEGVVLKKVNHTYLWNNKDTPHWVKVRYE